MMKSILIKYKKILNKAIVFFKEYDIMLMGNYILLNLLNHISFIKIRNSGLGGKVYV